MAVRVWVYNDTVIVDNGIAKANVINVESFFFDKDEDSSTVTLRDRNDDYKLRALSSDVQDESGTPYGTFTDVVNFLSSIVSAAATLKIESLPLPPNAATETTLSSINDKLEGSAKDPQISLVTLDGSTPSSVQWVSLWFRGNNGTFKGVSIPNGTRISYVPNKGEDTVNSAAYTVPTTGAGEILITWLP